MSCGACSWWPPIRVGELTGQPTTNAPPGVRPAPIPATAEQLGIAPPATEFDWVQLTAGAVIGVLGTLIVRRMV